MSAHVIPEILMRSVTKRFDNARPVLESIDINISPGEFVSIIGPSGCGKSTLLKLVAGLEPVSSGEVCVNGMEPRNARELVSFVFAPGERIRLEIAASAFPLYDRNPGNTTPASAMTPFNWSRSTHTLHHSADLPSKIRLPVIA